MDTIRAINDYIFTYLRADITLIDLLGNYNIHEGLAHRSSDYPYIVFALSPEISPDTPLVADCSFQTDIWDKPADGLTSRIFEIRGRLIKLLDQHTFILDGNEAKGIRIFLDSMGVILRDPDDEFIQHMVTGWSLRFIRSGDLVY